MPSSKGSSPLSVQAHVSCITDGFFTADCQGNHIYIYIYIYTHSERERSPGGSVSVTFVDAP